MVLESSMVLCVRASNRRSWIPVPTVKIGQEPCVGICSSQRWLQQVLVAAHKNRDTLDVSLAVKAFEQHVRTHVDSLQQAGKAKDEVPHLARKKRRLLDDSDDEGDVAKPSTGESASSPDSQRNAKKNACQQWDS